MGDLAATDTKKGKKIGYFNSYIMNRIDHRKNFLCCVTGPTGSGKTYAVLKEGEVLDPDFDVRNICFTPKEFMDLIDGKTKKLKRGSVIVFDEVQVTMGNLDYQKIVPKLVNIILSTFRYKGYIVFFTTPHFAIVTSTTRKMFHSRWETAGINYSKGVCSLKPFLLQVNQETGQIYRKYLRVWTKETGVIPYERLKVKMPSKKLIETYEEVRNVFVTRLNEKIRAELEAAETVKVKKTFKHTCQRDTCKYEWEGYKERPVKCPECNLKLKYDRNPLENGVLKVENGDEKNKGPF